jgi:hypothetical protein
MWIGKEKEHADERRDHEPLLRVWSDDGGS